MAPIPAALHTDDVKAAMMRFEYFHRWSEATIAECCVLSSIKTYSKNRTILGDGFGLPNSVYFVLRGQCKILEDLFVKPYTVNWEKRYRLYKPDCHEVNRSSYLNNEDSSYENSNKVTEPNQITKSELKSINGNEKKLKSSPSKVEMHIIQVCILNPLSCFGFGEYMERRCVIATSTTECLLIPRYWLMQQSMNNIWNRIQILLLKNIPTTEEVFSEFVNQRRWLNHRRKITDAVIANRKSTSNNILCNVPYYLRISNNSDPY